MRGGLEDVFHEAFAVELLEAVGFFSGADEARGDAQFFLNGGGNAPFSRAIKLGEDESVERDGFLKFTGLIECISTGGGIDYDEGFMRSIFVLLADGAFDLGELVHEVVAGVKSPGGVAEEELDIPAVRTVPCVVAKSGRVGLVLALDDFKAELFTPAAELFDRGSAEGVGRDEQAGAALGF